MVLRPILMLIMVSFLMDIHPEKSPEKKTPTINLATADRQFGTTAKNEAAIFPLIPIASENLRVSLSRLSFAYECFCQLVSISHFQGEINSTSQYLSITVRLLCFPDVSQQN